MVLIRCALARFTVARLTLAWLSVLAPIALRAAPVEADQALDAAVGWLQFSRSPMGQRAGTAGAISTVVGPSGQPIYHVCSLQPEGFVVLAADDEVESVVAFSAKGQFAAERGRPLFDLLERDLGQRISATRAAVAAGQPAQPHQIRAKAKWRTLLARAGRGAAAIPSDGTAEAWRIGTVDDVRVEPMLKSTWNQSTVAIGGHETAVYNYFTPPYGAGNSYNYSAGCTATAWAQIMRFHEWPKDAVGGHPVTYTLNGTPRTVTLRGGDGAGGPYDWSKMVLRPDAAITLEQREAIGSLLFDAGTANQMSYTSTSSAAALRSDAVKAAFHYADASYMRGTLADVLLALRTNLDAGLPVGIAIWDLYFVIGHEPVCDGYGYNLTTLYHHLNMGWGGEGDAWYALPNVDDPYYGFAVIDACTYNISPKAGGEIISGRITGPDGTGLAGATVTIRGATTATVQTNARGIFAMKGFGSNATWTVSPRAAGYVFTPAQLTVTTGTSVDFEPVGNRLADFTARGATGTLIVPTLRWDTPPAIAHGVALSGLQLNASVDVPGSLSYTPALGTVLGIGTHPLSVVFTPDDPANYATATADVSLTVTAERSQLVNIATRAFAGAGNHVTIGGFVLSGSAPRQVLIRAVGPSLTGQGLAASEVLVDPSVEVHHGPAIIAENDDWGKNAAPAEITAVATRIGAAPLLASDTKSSALLLTLEPGVYSFIAKNKSNGQGIVLLEVYDAQPGTAGANFVDIATRASARADNGVAIGGFVISGTSMKQVLLRAVGPSLTKQGLAEGEVLTDPQIELHKGAATIATNDDWSAGANAEEIRTTAARLGAAPLEASDTRSAALLIALEPGVYSFIAKGKSATPGIVLIEVYDAD